MLEGRLPPAAAVEVAAGRPPREGILNWPRPEPLVGLGNDGKLKPPPKEGMEKDGMLNWGTGEAWLKPARAAM